MKKKKNILLCVLLVCVSIVFTILTKVVDVQEFNNYGNIVSHEKDVAEVVLKTTKIGFGTINIGIFNKLGVNEFLYNITEFFGYIALALAGTYALVGLIQLIKRKSFLKVDKEIYVLAGFYIILISLYFGFDKVALNFRPTVIDGILKASFPSSHTLLIVGVFGSSIILNNDILKNKYSKIFNILSYIIIFATVVGRLLSGAHWFTDIVGGVLIACTLLKIFKTIIKE